MLSPYKVYFKNAKEGYVPGMSTDQDGIIALTKNCGNTWETFNTHIKTQLYDMSFLNDSVALVYGSNGILFKWHLKSTVFTGIEENSPILQASIYPNPAKDKLRIGFDGAMPGIMKMAIYDLSGRELKSGAIFDMEIDIRDLEKGLYLLSIDVKEKKAAFRFIKE